MNTLSKQRGVSLIEVMATLLVFLVGMLGVSLYTMSGMKSITVSQSRASAIKTASQGYEPMFRHTRRDCLDVMLRTFPRTVKGDNDKETQTVNLLKAVDGAGNLIATLNSVNVASATWTSPVIVTLSIPYAGLGGAVVQATPSFSLQLQNYTEACDA